MQKDLENVHKILLKIFFKIFKIRDIIGFYSNVKGLITMETSVRIKMEADVTMDLCSKATMKKSVSIEGLRPTIQFTARSRRDYTHFAVIRESVVLVRFQVLTAESMMFRAVF
jgi:hypothetical protein